MDGRSTSRPSSLPPQPQHHSVQDNASIISPQESLPAYTPISRDRLPASPLTPRPPEIHLPQHDQTIVEQQEAGPGDAPPPAYDEVVGRVDLREDEVGGQAQVAEDGRVNINISQKSRRMSAVLRAQFRVDEKDTTTPIPAPLRHIPPLNILIQIIGSRGDVQPFIALGKALRTQHGHRVRVATHPVFKSFVEENGLEFFSLGGDPSELMAFMVKNPGLVPGMESLKNGDVGKRRKGMWEVLLGGWRACFEPGDGMGSTEGKPFVADAIIANPPSFGHVHCAEKLGIPLHLMFTMPWSPTASFPHPLANIQSSNADKSVTNFLSYVFVEILTWQGLGDLVNKFREQTLGLPSISTIWAPGAISRLKVPYTYCWSPSLIPKPEDWGQHIGISGFFFLSLASGYTPPPDLADFLAQGPPPVYIGFGSIVVDDPNALTQKIIRAVELAGCRAVVSKGWGGIGGANLQVPPNVFLLDNCPHDWLFPQCAAVVHHGGAGTTSAGIRCGKPTVVVPFFGDQAFWGNMVCRAGAGPEPLPQKLLTAERLAERIKIVLSNEAKSKAMELGRKVCAENGVDEGVKDFHRSLQVKKCDLLPDRVAVWKTRKGNVKLSAVAAAILVGKGLVENGWDGLRLCRHREWPVDEGAIEPLSGGASALMGTIGSMMGGVSEVPKDVGRIFAGSSKGKERAKTQNQVGGNNGASTSVDSFNTALSPISTRNTSSTSINTPQGKFTHPTISRTTSATSATSTDTSTPRPATPTTQERINTALAASGGINKIVSAGIRSPLDFTLGLAQGFRNAPRLYNDTTVRPPPHAPTGLHSGIKTAGKELALGIYDGVTGLVTQPIIGAKQSGAGGAVRGFGKGAAGLVLKGGAGFWGLQAYMFKGIHAEVLKLSVKDVDKGLWSARMRQGIEEAEDLDEEVINEVVETWEVMKITSPGLEKRGSFFGSGKDRERSKGKEKEKHKNKDKRKYKHPQMEKRSASFSTLFSDNKSTTAKNIKEEDHRDYLTGSSASASADEADQLTAHKRELVEEAIRRSVAETSHGNESEDAQVEAAIRESLMDPDVAEAMRLSLVNVQNKKQPQPSQLHQPALQRSVSSPATPRQTGNTEDSEDRDIREALRLSMLDSAAQHHSYLPPRQSQTPPPQTPHQDNEEEELAEAIRRSLAISQPHDATPQTFHPQPGHTDSDDDEDLKKALAESLKTANYRPYQQGSSSSHQPSLSVSTSKAGPSTQNPVTTPASTVRNWSSYSQQQQAQEQPQMGRSFSIQRKPVPTSSSSSSLVSPQQSQAIQHQPIQSLQLPPYSLSDRRPSWGIEDDDEYGSGYTPPVSTTSGTPSRTPWDRDPSRSSPAPPPAPPHPTPATNTDTAQLPEPLHTERDTTPTPNPLPRRTRTWDEDSTTSDEDEEDWEMVEKVMRESLEEQERKRREMERALAEVVARREERRRGGGGGGFTYNPPKKSLPFVDENNNTYGFALEYDWDEELRAWLKTPSGISYILIARWRIEPHKWAAQSRDDN
ncbi:hypothetical protein EX30DRAFT_398682 [Ascodesmis nigricans]|uniref:Uncharacterized protein n=1 Tax=Ascodesmis nigricans TaxID=341454 RepID=A0A4S2MJT4_9PEZI|nr:hypothetical protein EX30DRAFT_398682 [Ascodesmis nigricans]